MKVTTPPRTSAAIVDLRAEISKNRGDALLDPRGALRKGHQFQTDWSPGGYWAQMSVVWAAPLLLKNSFWWFGHATVS
jgi:hypothetical protein